MKLEKYPLQIAHLAKELLKLQSEQRRVTESLALIDNQIDRAIAFDTDLKNDAQRKAKAKELREESSQRAELSAQLQELGDRIRLLEIDIEYYRNEYRLRTLLLRQEVARLESIA